MDQNNSTSASGTGGVGQTTTNKEIFDDHHYAFATRTPLSEQSTFDSQSSSRRPSTFEQSHSPARSRREEALSHSTSASTVVGSAALASPTMSTAPSAFLAQMQKHNRTPSEAQSVHSSSSSLRQAYDVLRGGVFPPGMRNARKADDGAASDASHYDEDEDDAYSFEAGGPFQSASPRLAFPSDATADASQDDEMYNNALDSPDVPLRRSSATGAAATATHSGNSSNHIIDVQRRGSSTRSSMQGKRDDERTHTPASAGGPTMKQRSATVTTKARTSDHEPLSPTSMFLSSTQTSTKGSAGTTDDSSKNEDEAALERRLEAAAAADPSRPRTLKEARALAKERARLRMQAKEASDAPEENDGKPIASHIRTLSANDKREAQLPTDSTRHDNRRVHVLQDASSLHSQAQHPTSRGLTQKDDTQLGDMSDLQAAVGEALEDLSFTSGATTTSAGSGPAATLQPLSQSASVPVQSPNNLLRTTSAEGDVESIAPSTQSFDSAPESPFASNGQVGSIGAVVSETNAPSDQTDAQPPTIQVIHTPANALPHSPAYPTPLGNSLASMQTDQDSNMAKAQQHFKPHLLQSQQRSTAPNKIARLDVYGKTIPFPAAFDPTAIVEQRRLAPWERARSYAHYCNDLMSTSSGLHIWLEMVQRPAQRIAAAAAATSSPSTSAVAAQVTPTKRHVRGEGTDHSAYAASVRSDATFPMRGDGGRAKEIVSHHPTEASIPEGPTTTVPQNLPYPILASASSGAVSAQQGANASRHQIRSSQDGALTNSVDRQNSRNFFSNLGRRNSSRRPTHPSMTGLSTLASNSAAKGAISSIRSRGITLSKSSSMDVTPSSHDSTSLTISSPIQQQQPMQPSMSSSMHHSSSSSSSTGTPLSPPSASSRNGPQGPRALNNPSPLSNAPSYFASLSSPAPAHISSPTSSSSHDQSKVGLHGLSSSGGIYSIPSEVSGLAPTDYSAGTGDRRSPRANAPSLPPSTSVKNSLSYGSVRDARRPTLPSTNSSTLQPPQSSIPSSYSSDSHGSGKNSLGVVGSAGGNGNGNGVSSGGGPFGSLSRRRSSNVSTAAMTPEESEALDKLCDVLPDADRTILLEYLRRANGNDLTAIGDYLQDQSKAQSSKMMR